MFSDRDWNRTTLKGWVGNPPKFHESANGICRLSFSVATHRRVPKAVPITDKTEWEDATDWHNVVCWGSLATRGLRSLRKGHRVWVEGALRYRKYTDADGITRSVAEIVGDQLVVISESQPKEEEPMPTLGEVGSGLSKELSVAPEEVPAESAESA